MFGIQVALSRVCDDLPNLLCPQAIEQICRDLGYAWRNRVLDPSTTLFAFLTQVLHGNTACSHLPHLLGRKFTASAYCQARARLPIAVFERLLTLFHAFLPPTSEGGARWHGHRTFYVDGSARYVPDTAELDEHFGRPSGVRQGEGFPMGSIVALFDATTGLLLSVVTSRFRTSELRQVSRMHHQLHAGDVLVGDSAYRFCNRLSINP